MGPDLSRPHGRSHRVRRGIAARARHRRAAGRRRAGRARRPVRPAVPVAGRHRPRRRRRASRDRRSGADRRDPPHGCHDGGGLPRRLPRAAGVVEPGVGRDLARARPEPRRPRLGCHRGLLRGGLARRRRRRVPGAAAAHGAGRGARLGTRHLAGALPLRPRRVASRPARDRGASRSARLRGSRRGGRAGRRLLRLPAGGGRPPGLRPVAGGLCRRGGGCGVVRPAHRQRAGRPELRELPLARGRAEGRDAGRGPDPPGRPLRRQPARALRRACDARDRRRGARSSGRAEPPQRGGDEAAVGRDGALPHGVGLPAARARARRAGARRPDRRARRRPGRARRDRRGGWPPAPPMRRRTSCTCSGCWRPSGRGRSATSAAPPSPSTARSARPRSERGHGTGR